jgi:N-acetylneuraminate synthase
MKTERILPVREWSGGGDPGKRLVIAEIAQGHDGSLGMAHAYIDAVAEAGADAVKFQTHIADAESTPSEPWREEFSRQDETRFDYWKRMEFTEPQWNGLREHATERGLYFLSSAFSKEAVRMLKRVGVAAWKIASGEVGNSSMIEEMIETKWPVLLSTGMSTMEEIDAAVAAMRAGGAPLAVLQATSAYPTPAEKLGLNMLEVFRNRYGCGVGLSDHTGNIFSSLAAVSLGASVVEVHVVFHRGVFGPDVSSSITVAELGELVRGVRFLETALATEIDKDAIAADLAPVREIFGKSIVAEDDLKAGTILTSDHLSLKKPGTGLGPSRMAGMIGKKLKRAVSRNHQITEEDVEAGED